MALQAVFDTLKANGFEPHLQETLNHQVVGWVVSSKFEEDPSPRVRSDRIWSVLRKSLSKEDLLRVGGFLLMTEKEYHERVGE